MQKQELTVGEAASHIEATTGETVPPHVLSRLFYKRQLDHRVCPIVGRARLIRVDYLPEIEATLRERRILPPAEKPEAAPY